MVDTVPEPPPVDNAPARMRERPTWLISRAYARASGLLQEGFARSGDGLRSYHYRLLAALEEWGPASQAALGRSTGIDRSDVTAALVDLEARGLVRRAVNHEDRRRNVVSITEAGMSHLEVLDDVVSEVQDRLLAPLSQEERQQFVTLTRRIAGGSLPSPRAGGTMWR
jgi:DNA-binding MarR family transcriptional regulator